MSTAGVGQSWWVAATAFLGGTGLNVNTIPQPGAGAPKTVSQRDDGDNNAQNEQQKIKDYLESESA